MISLCSHLQIFVTRFVKALHGLLIILVLEHSDALFLPFLSIGLGDEGLKAGNILALISLLNIFFQDLLGNQLTETELTPIVLECLSAFHLILLVIIDDQTILGSGNGNVQHFELITQDSVRSHVKALKIGGGIDLLDGIFIGFRVQLSSKVSGRFLVEMLTSWPFVILFTLSFLATLLFGTNLFDLFFFFFLFIIFFIIITINIIIIILFGIFGIFISLFIIFLSIKFVQLSSFVNEEFLFKGFLINLNIINVDRVEDLPLVMSELRVREEIIKDDIIEFKTLSLINCQDKSVLKNHWQLVLALLISNQDNLIATEFDWRLLVLTLAFFEGLLLVVLRTKQQSKQHIKVDISQQNGLRTINLTLFLLQFIDGFGEESLNQSDN
mmetsp:Transcript_20409/g.17724  ORF Transcript_20409/g.17724 Transcript_20409/m.17724 type:complete len:384 (-) Transcript_20409:2796-3947(-)